MTKQKLSLLIILFFIILNNRIDGKSIRQTMIEASFSKKESEKILFSSLDFDGKEKTTPQKKEKNSYPEKKDNAQPVKKKQTTVKQLSKTIMNRINKYDKQISKYCQLNGLDKSFVKAVIYAESAGNYKAVSSKGAMGLMQLMPQTAASLNIKKPFHPEQNIKGGTKLLSMLNKYYKGDDFYMLWAYNAGMGRVKKNFMPLETENYIIKIKKLQKLIEKEEQKNE